MCKCSFLLATWLSSVPNCLTNRPHQTETMQLDDAQHFSDTNLFHSQEQFHFIFRKCKQSSSIIDASELEMNIFLRNRLWRKLWFIHSPNWHKHTHGEQERVCTKPSWSVDLSENQQNHDCFRFSTVASTAARRILFAHYSTIAAEFIFVNSSTSRLFWRTRINSVSKSRWQTNGIFVFAEKIWVFAWEAPPRNSKSIFFFTSNVNFKLMFSTWERWTHQFKWLSIFIAAKTIKYLSLIEWKVPTHPKFHFHLTAQRTKKRKKKN